MSTGTDCPTSADLTALRSGQVLDAWPAGGVLGVLAVGTAPQVTTGGNATLKFAALATSGNGTPDANRANNAPSTAKTLVKAPQVCNYVVNPTSLSLGTAAQVAQVAVLAGAGCSWTLQNSLPWLASSPSAGSGDGTVTLTPQPNTRGGRAERDAGHRRSDGRRDASRGAVHLFGESALAGTRWRVPRACRSR